MVETQFDTKIKALQSDWGGVLHKVACPYTPQQNGRVERKNRHVVEMGLTLLAHSSTPLSMALCFSN